MLPDYPEIKKRISDILLLRLKLTSWAKMGPLSQVRKMKIQEGDKHLLLRMDGTQDMTEPKEIKADFQLSNDETKNATMKELVELTDKLADEMARKTAEMMYSGIAKACDAVGNAVDAKGESMSPKLFFKVLDKIWIDFDDNGNPILPTLIVGDEKIGKKLLDDLKNDPQNDKLFSKIIEKKRIEFNDREANRKLVD